jgi:hypothetical protein
MLFAFAVPSWGLIAKQHSDSYRYDGSRIAENTQNHNYGVVQNLWSDEVRQAIGLSEKTLGGCFFAFSDGFFVTKGVTPNAQQAANLNRFQKKYRPTQRVVLSFASYPVAV